MSKEKKTFTFKHVSQEIKFRDSNHYRPKTHQKFEEHILPENDLDQIEEEKIDLSSPKLVDEPKMVIEVDSNSQNNVLVLHDDNIKFDLNIKDQNFDSQSLSQSSVDKLLHNEEEKSLKTTIVPSSIKVRKPYKEKNNTELSEKLLQDNLPTLPTAPTVSLSNIQKDKEHSHHVALSDNSLEEKEITRTSFSSFNNRKNLESKNSFFNKKPKKIPSKNENILEEETNGIFRTSSFKNKNFKKPKKITDENEISRTSESYKFTSKTNTNYNGRKVFVYNEEKLYNYGINRLSEQDYGRHELFKKMAKLQEDESIINKVLDKLESQKFLSDTNRIRSFLMSYSNSESINKTKQRLIQKGFNKKNIEAVIEDMENTGIYTIIQDTETEEDKAIKLLVRKYRIYEVEKSEKMSRFLISKGFQFDIVSKAMKTFSNGDFDSFDPY